ncbi:MAG TPA: hypothetical protein VGW76_03555, partial [Pyrinomonadaceae bacterium]|nr:hypothetical protein [Pyrinomonadaceae bacterium]
MKSRLLVVVLGVVFFPSSNLSLLRAETANPKVHPKTCTALASRDVAGSARAFNGPSAGGLREDVNPRFRKRYEEWKTEFLSTDIGRLQWQMYAQHSHLTLTITVAEDNKNGAGTGGYKWNDAGELVAATIVLGNRIDEGYPNSIYYPVMNALEPYES